MANRQLAWEQKFAPVFNTGVDVKVWRDMDQLMFADAFTLQVDALIIDTSVGTYQGPIVPGPFSVNVPVAGSSIQGQISDVMFEDKAGAPATQAANVAALYFVITGSGGIRVPLKHLPIKVPMSIPSTTVVVPIPEVAPATVVPPPPAQPPPTLLKPVFVEPIEMKAIAQPTMRAVVGAVEERQ